MASSQTDCRSLTTSPCVSFTERVDSIAMTPQASSAVPRNTSEAAHGVLARARPIAIRASTSTPRTYPRSGDRDRPKLATCG